MVPKLLHSLIFAFIWVITTPSTTVEAYLARRGCSDTCGDIQIPFPFGIGSGCYLNEWFSIDCRSEEPYLTNLNLQVLNITLNTRIVTINTPTFYENQTTGFKTFGVNLINTPFFISKEDNKLMLFGCGDSFLIHQDNDNKIISGCMSMCPESGERISSCYGIKCCETNLPFYLRGYQLNFTRSDSRLNISTFVVDEKWEPSSFENPFDGSDRPSIPLKLAWTIQSSDLAVISSCLPLNLSIELESGVFHETWSCPCRNNFQYQNTDINPYLDGQCNVALRKWSPVILGVGTSLGVLLLVFASFMSYKVLKRRNEKKKKDKFFKRNGGILLQKQLSVDDRIIEKTRIFTASECEKATEKFNENRILGRGGQGTVYKGMLTDGRIVAIKRSKLDEESQIEQFINELVLLSQVVHKNVVKLLGCCLETEVPLLVYEFIPNGTLFDLIQGKNDELLTWDFRLRIATEVASALGYLHSEISTPIYHRDIKSSNILLDERYTAKVSDFGTSRPISIDRTHLTTLVQGTFGYVDPEYFRTSQFTDKSDVYSFGVVLVELLTRKKAISSIKTKDEASLGLAACFTESMQENSLETIVDTQILDHKNAEEIIAVAALAHQCLDLSGKKRPSMKEVAIELERIRLMKMDHDDKITYQTLGSFLEEQSTEFSDQQYSTWTVTSSSSWSSPDMPPQLFNTM